MCEATHQCGLVGGEDYDSKETRLAQLLARVPLERGPIVVFVASPTSAAAARSVIEASRRPNASVVAVAGRAAASCASPPGCSLAINYDLPSTGREYVRRLSALCEWLPLRVMYTFIEEHELKSRPCRELVGLLRRAKKAAAADPWLGGDAKAAEFEAALGQIDEEEEAEEEEEEEEEDGEDDGACDCQHCCSGVLGSMSHHHAKPSRPSGAHVRGAAPDVEVVRMPLRALENIEAAAPFIAPRCPKYACTVICLHMLYCHTPWDGWEQLFANKELEGTVRVILLLADDSSWHDYPDHATLGAGGVSWCDILDVDMMQRSDMLLERLIDHEAKLLGDSERIVLFGASQGGGQSMLRFLRSQRRLAGWVGAVCHVPTAPHTPIDQDPLLQADRPLVNCDRPVRLLAGEVDTVFPSGLVLRDADRMRTVGGFSDVQVEVQTGLRHDGWDEEPEFEANGELQAWREVPELLFLRRHLPSLLRPTAQRSERSPSPEWC